MGVAHGHKKMRNITHCPNCQTQFFVSEDQLKQHGGLVRCGQCLHVFNAKEQFVSTSSSLIEEVPTSPVSPSAETTEARPTIERNTPSTWPKVDLQFATTATTTHDTQANAESATSHPNSAALETTNSEQTAFAIAHTATIVAPPHVQDNIEEYSPNDVTKLNFTSQSEDLNEVVKFGKQKTEHKLSYRWLWMLGTFLLVLTAIAQSAYYLRNTIAIYYPNLKPHLLVACQHLGCKIELPKQIESIFIDDSDMQEDLAHPGVIRLSSSLFNKAGFSQAYPNIELTLTDTNDSAILRRIFKPAEYLPPNTDIAAGFAAGREIKIKLAISTNDVSAAGYRLYVSY